MDQRNLLDQDVWLSLIVSLKDKSTLDGYKHSTREIISSLDNILKKSKSYDEFKRNIEKDISEKKEFLEYLNKKRF